MEPTGAPGRRSGGAPLLLAACLLGGCASTEPAWSPGELDSRRQQQCRTVERAYREELPEYPALRDELAKDPVAISWYVRMLIRDLLTVREGRPLGSDEDLLRAAAKIEHIVEIRALAEIDAIGVAAVPTIVGDLLRHSQPLLRELGFELIGRIGAPALPALRDLARDEEVRHRRAAARAAAAIGITPEVLALLRQLANDPEFTVRADALRGLRLGGGDEARTLLCARMRDDGDPFVRRQAARSLVGHPAAASALALVDYLARCKLEKDAPGEEAAQDALMALAGAKGPRTEAAWRQWASAWQPAIEQRPAAK
jgi:HEAT repeat protein